jgi:glycosyltransferase involved in cell wall biosynthesis
MLRNLDINKIQKQQQEYLSIEKGINKIQPQVSIFITAYQHVRYIAECLESILMQKISFPLEIVIGEDGSIDGTQDICMKYALLLPDKIRLFLRDRKQTAIYDEKGRFVKSINGILTSLACRGQYIAICEGDDYWTDPHKLQKEFDFLESNQGYGLVHTNLDVYYEETNSFKRTIHSDNDSKLQGSIFENLLIENPIATLTTMFRTEYLKRIILDQMNRFKMSDLFLWLEIAKHSKIGYINDVTAVYRVHPSSVSQHNDNAGRIEFQSSAFDLKYYFIEKYGCSRETEESVYRKALDTWYSLKALPLFMESYERLRKKGMLNATDKMKYRFINLPFLYYFHKLLIRGWRFLKKQFLKSHH